jgi:hypothetical protein
MLTISKQTVNEQFVKAGEEQNLVGLETYSIEEYDS